VDSTAQHSTVYIHTNRTRNSAVSREGEGNAQVIEEEEEEEEARSIILCSKRTTRANLDIHYISQPSSSSSSSSSRARKTEPKISEPYDAIIRGNTYIYTNVRFF